MSNLSLDELQRIECLKIEAIKAQCWANYWVNFAKSDTNLHREVYHDGISKEYRGERFTMAELEEQAFNTAKSHIMRLEEIQREIIRVIIG